MSAPAGDSKIKKEFLMNFELTIYNEHEYSQTYKEIKINAIICGQHIYENYSKKNNQSNDVIVVTVGCMVSVLLI